MTQQEFRKAMARAAMGVAGFAAGAASTVVLPPAALPICVTAGTVLFLLGCRSALQIARVDDLVFAPRPIWRAPDPPVSLIPQNSSDERRSRVTFARPGKPIGRRFARTGLQDQAP